MEYDANCRKKAEKSRLLCCKMYISEARNAAVLASVEEAVNRNRETIIVNKFTDRAYNRTNYTLVSYVVRDAMGVPIYSPIQEAVVAMTHAAYEAINLQCHSGSHPRLGVVDDIIFFPLHQASIEDAASLAKAVANHIGTTFRVPVYLYGAAHPTGKAADAIRRSLGYYRPNFNGIQWAGWDQPEEIIEEPDEGPTQLSPSKGICMVGARPWIEYYNIPIMSTDVSVARRIARLVSARGGGIPTVQTLGLVHGEESTEITCMLLEPKRVGAERVQNRVEMLAAQSGVAVEKGYFTDLSLEMIIEKYLCFISSGIESAH